MGRAGGVSTSTACPDYRGRIRTTDGRLDPYGLERRYRLSLPRRLPLPRASPLRLPRGLLASNRPIARPRPPLGVELLPPRYRLPYARPDILTRRKIQREFPRPPPPPAREA